MEAEKQMTERDDSKLLQVHLAEYQMLTTRCNYWIAIQAAFIPVVFVILGVVAAGWGHIDARILLWGAIFLLVFGVIHITEVLAEHYKATLYMESELRKAVRDLVGKS